VLVAGVIEPVPGVAAVLIASSLRPGDRPPLNPAPEACHLSRPVRCNRPTAERPDHREQSRRVVLQRIGGHPRLLKKLRQRAEATARYADDADAFMADFRPHFDVLLTAIAARATSSPKA